MATTQRQMVQLNVRVDADVKRQAEEVLELMGSSVTELVRMALEKVARGARDYVEARDALNDKHGGETPVGNAIDQRLAEGWAIISDLYRSFGIDSSTLPVDERSWKEVYEEAMIAHYEEKGLLQ